jgi:hypothetical protein
MNYQQNYNYCNFSIKFLFNEIDGKTMSVKVNINDEQEIIISNQKSYVFSKEIILPSLIRLNFFGKNQNTDTIVDENNTIVKDKSVIIESMSLDQIDIDEAHMHSLIKLHTQDNTIVHSNYIGFNGHVDLDLTQTNVFFQTAEFQSQYSKNSTS